MQKRQHVIQAGTLHFLFTVVPVDKSCGYNQGYTEDFQGL